MERGERCQRSYTIEQFSGDNPQRLPRNSRSYNQQNHRCVKKPLEVCAKGPTIEDGQKLKAQSAKENSSKVP